MDDSPRPRPVVLCVLDGWGYRKEREDNAIALARTPVWDRLMAECPHALLDASAGAVGLPDGQMGNSEVGHMNIGAGRIVLQELPKISKAAAGGALAKNKVLRAFIDALKASGGTAHLMGLVSPGGVHSHQEHIAALARIIAAAGVTVAVHAFLDGRDTPPRSARGYLEDLLTEIDDTAAPVFVATVTGRYYAMDRDKRWERIELAYDALVSAEGERAPDALAAVDDAYARGESDEFVRPTVIAGFGGMADGDGLLMANFRADRARQILTALTDPDFDGFTRARVVDFAARAGLVQYSEALNERMTALFPAESLPGTIGEVVAKAGLKQLRIAETEKYAHVTFFLNGGEEREFKGEDRILVPSPKVATYDLQPEMSAYEVTDKLVEAIGRGRYDLIVVNYANTDMVGHTGDLAAAIKAVEAVDACLGRLDAAVRAAGGALLITSDHGNAELMRDAANGQPHTAHTTRLVPVVVSSAAAQVPALKNGRLCDVAPTLLALMRLPQPKEMTGGSLIAASGAALAPPEHRVSA
jgi:2,3-bisphosphoglycerate-independent phosphoglycerate mutase